MRRCPRDQTAADRLGGRIADDERPDGPRQFGDRRDRRRGRVDGGRGRLRRRDGLGDGWCGVAGARSRRWRGRRHDGGGGGDGGGRRGDWRRRDRRQRGVVDLDRCSVGRHRIRLPVVPERCREHDDRRQRRRTGRREGADERGRERDPRGVSDRLFEEEVAGDGHDEGEAEPDEHERRPVEPDPIGVDDHIDRPVVQVHAVRDLADEHQRSDRERRAGGALDLQPEQQCARHDGNQWQGTLVRRPTGGREQHDGTTENQQTSRCERGETVRQDGPARQRDGEERPDQDLGQPRRGRPVGSIGTPHLRDHGSGQHCRDGDAADRQHPCTMGPDGSQQPEHHEGPQPVELLLDRERPEVLERRRRAVRLGEQLLVRAVTRQQHPVGHLEERPDHLRPQRADAHRTNRSARRARR